MRGEKNQFLKSQLGTRPGEILDLEGMVLGQHQGYFLYTIGQRTGLNITIAPTDGQPRYVLKVDPQLNQVIVGPASYLETNKIKVSEIITYQNISAGQTFDCQIRAHTQTVPARIESIESGSALISSLSSPFLAAAPGQTLVGYRSDQVIFSGIIHSAQLR
jgi:tRNA-specific 2-thiouridylase